MRRVSFFRFLCKNEVTFDDKVYQIEKAKEPTPADNKEQHEYNYADYVHLFKHNTQSYKQLDYPTYERNDEENNLDKGALGIKPLVE